jgi:YVTN family beta-propeller protein
MTSWKCRLVVAVLTLVACSHTPAEQVTDNIPPGDLLLVANKQDADLWVIHLASGRTVKKVTTGVGPHEIAVSRDGQLAVVSNYGQQGPGNSLTVIDTRTFSVARTVDLGSYQRPHGIAFLPDNRTVAVTSEVAQALVLVDVVAGTVKGAVGTEQQGTHMVVLRADGKRAYTANIGSGSTTEIDLETQQRVRTVQVAAQSEGIGLSPNGQELWAGSNEEGIVRAFQTQDLTAVATVQAPGVPIRVLFSPDGSRVLVSCAQAGVVRIFNAATRAQIAQINVGGSPVGAVFSANGSKAYVALSGANSVAVIDLGSLSVQQNLATGNGPDGIAFLPR